jgi:hypothetical protein
VAPLQRLRDRVAGILDTPNGRVEELCDRPEAEYGVAIA